MVFQGDEPEYPPEQVEIMSDHHLRVTLGLDDGVVLEFSLVAST
jgi:CTP-dependent riboflavin kinase